MPVPLAAGLAGAIATALISVIRVWAVSIIGRILGTIGIGIFSYKFAVPAINEWIGGQFHALPEFVRESVGACGIDSMVTMVVSALAVKRAARFFFGLTGGGAD